MGAGTCGVNEDSLALVTADGVFAAIRAEVSGTVAAVGGAS
jgi:hypothetical protein